eukprot:TRINITY_DN64094_c0_g1_i1.p2 TRINITY_DN64094_c0_g1~~TRINITY_DN64094_c0_g1_i1.p2  ORF type:complete len:105 (+),score=9.09 TRINITY_DN64094_c0_g1_i1:106-420(+)
MSTKVIPPAIPLGSVTFTDPTHSGFEPYICIEASSAAGWNSLINTWIPIHQKNGYKANASTQSCADLGWTAGYTNGPAGMYEVYECDGQCDAAGSGITLPPFGI